MSKDINPMHGRCCYSKKIFDIVLKKCGCPSSILELGCGVGLNLKEFINTSIKVGIDPLESNIVLARKNNPHATILFDSHLCLINFADKKFDVGITCSVLNHIEGFENALNELIRTCKKLVLVEPMIEGVHRQALASETVGKDNTWYFNYRKFLNDGGKFFTIEKTPLYSKNSGSLYHTIFVNCEK